jgi:DNA-binding NarL/FixJ family response regulator
METTSSAAKPLKAKYGGPSKVLLVAGPAALLQRMVEVVQTTEGAQLAGGFATAEDALDWTIWQREAWHLAYVDVNLPQADDILKRLLSQQRPGTVIGISDHLWKEVRARCAAMGVSDIVEKGDLIAFRGDLEARLR